MTYFFDFMNSLINKTKIPVCIYLILNVIVIVCLLSSLFGASNIDIAFFFSLMLYTVSLIIALSPIGEWILRFQNGCHKIKRKDQKDYIEPIFKEVFEKAKKLDSSISSDAKLYIIDSKDVNAFAVGRKTVCITEGMLNAPREQIKASLAHEIGHLAHKDTDLILLITVGNFIVTFIFIAVRVFGMITTFFWKLLPASNSPAQEGARIGAIVESYIIDAIIVALMWVWTKIGILLVMRSNRANEFEADKFAFKLGYGNALCELLDSSTGKATKGLWANLMNSHPDKNDRIAELMNLGATYRKLYGVN